MSTYDSGISVTAVEPSDLDVYLKYGSYSVAQYLASIKYFLTGSSTPSFTGSSFLTLLRDVYEDFFYGNGYYLASTGNSSSSGGNNSIAEYLRNGFLGLSTNIKAVTSAIQALEFNDYSSILSSIYSSVDGLESGLTSANTAIGGVTTSVNNVRTAVNNVVSGLSTVNTSVGTVNTSVGTVNSSIIQVDENLNNFYNYFMSNFFNFSAGQIYLKDSGVLGSLSYAQPFLHTFRLGLVGLSRNIQGNSGTNSYSSTLNDNNNTTTTVNSTGLGPLLNTQLSNIGENLGHLAYVFASDEDIKLREDSQPLLDTTDSFYDDSDNNVKISTNNVGSLKDIAGNFTSIIDADSDISDAFAVVSNSNTYRWFSADTAMNLDSLGVATVDFDESTYDRLHREFNEIYFPDRVGGGN